MVNSYSTPPAPVNTISAPSQMVNVFVPVMPPGLAVIVAEGVAVTSIRMAVLRSSHTIPLSVLIVLRLKKVVLVNVPGS